MSEGSLKTQIVGIEAQLRVLMASRGAASGRKKPKGLRALEGALRGKGKFTPEEIQRAKLQSRDDL